MLGGALTAGYNSPSVLMVHKTHAVEAGFVSGDVLIWAGATAQHDDSERAIYSHRDAMTLERLGKEMPQ